jgi:F420-dependent oxidoreductase-like protein
MRTAIMLSAEAGRWPELVDYVVEAEALGVDIVWVAEAWGADAATPLGYLAARTERIQLASGVFQVGVRSPVMTAQTAITLAEMSGGRFVLGLGTSGPQVMEGLHGVRFDHPLGRVRETIDIIQQALAGEKIRYEGRHFALPLAGGEGKAMRLSIKTEHRVPIYLATLSPKLLELTGERADGWLGTAFVPEGAAAYFESLRIGAERAGRHLSDLDICQGAEVAFARDEAELARMVEARKAGVAFTLGGMGSATTNFYNRAYARQGWDGVAAEAQALWVSGRRAEAAAVIPDEMVLATTLVGTEPMVRQRLQTWRDVGVTTARFYPYGDTLGERLDTLARTLDLVRAMGPQESSNA